MKAARILSFGAPSVITDDDLPEPKPAEREDRAECRSVMSGEQKMAEMSRS